MSEGSSKSIWEQGDMGDSSTFPTWAVFPISGKEAIPFLQHVLTKQLPFPSTLEWPSIRSSRMEKGGALDDAYLYRLDEDDGRSQKLSSRRERRDKRERLGLVYGAEENISWSHS